MRFIKATIGICAAAFLACSMSGCIVLPPRGHGGYYHDYHGWR